MNSAEEAGEPTDQGEGEEVNQPALRRKDSIMYDARIVNVVGLKT